MAIKRTRVPHSKSIGGCQTCKRRKVKCDENLPNCKRCASTGRICEGPRPVNIVLYHHKQERKLHLTSPTRSPGLKVLPWLTQPEEASAFSYYLSRAAPFLAGALDEGLWDVLVPQLAQIDNAVRYATFAISQFFRYPVRGNRGGQIEIVPVSRRHLEALAWHAKALSAARSHGNSSHKNSVLVKCVLFSSLEYQQNNFRSGLQLIRTGYALVAPLLTAGCNNMSTARLPQDEIVSTVLPMFMRNVALLFTSWDGAYFDIATKLADSELEGAVFRCLCTVYATLKDTYLARKAHNDAALHRLDLKQIELKSFLRRLQARTQAASTCVQHFLHPVARTLSDYCDVALSWLNIPLSSRYQLPGDVGLLKSLNEHVKTFKAQSTIAYPDASKTTYFHHMAVAPVCYLIAIFAPTMALRNEALKLMCCESRGRPNTQLYAIVMSLEGDIVNTSVLNPPPANRDFRRGQQEVIQEAYDVPIRPPIQTWQLRESDRFVQVAKRSPECYVQDSQVKCATGDMNGVHSTRHWTVVDHRPPMDTLGSSNRTSVQFEQAAASPDALDRTI